MTADRKTLRPTQLDTCAVRQIDAEKVQQGRVLLLSEQTYADAAAMFRALSDPSRAKIVYSLLQQELCVCDLAAVCELSESATSQHLRVLRNLRLVKMRRDGREAHYSVTDDHVRVLVGVCLNHLADVDPLAGIQR